MILSYEEAIKEYGSDYKLKKAIDSGVEIGRASCRERV